MSADDIEELVIESDANLGRTNVAAGSIFPKRPKKTNGKICEEEWTVNEPDSALTKDIPGTQKIWVKTYGCSHNVSDSEYMEGMLSSYGYSIVSDAHAQEADLWLINSCTVKDPSQAAFMHLVRGAKEAGRSIVVAGCVSQADRGLPGLEDVSAVGTLQIDRVVEVVEETLRGNTVKLLGRKALPRLDLPKVRRDPLVEIVPLSTGCLGACTYCKTKHARGALGSYAPEAIVERVRAAVDEGVSEIWLSSEDTGAYGIDLGTDIAALLRQILAALPAEGVMLRVGMTNPPYILAHLASIADILCDERVFAFLHVPVQAASDKVLRDMNREYTCAEFCQVVDFLQTHVPDITIATDVICGFPTETEEDFESTLQLIARYRFGVVNISQFYPRPGTPAARMRRLPTNQVKDRSRRLTQLFNSFTPHTGLVGRRVRVAFGTEVSDCGRTVGHSKGYVKVLVEKDDSLQGRSMIVEITNCYRFHVEGIVVPSQHIALPIAEAVPAIVSLPIATLITLDSEEIKAPGITRITGNAANLYLWSATLFIMGLTITYIRSRT